MNDYGAASRDAWEREEPPEPFAVDDWRTEDAQPQTAPWARDEPEPWEPPPVDPEPEPWRPSPWFRGGQGW